MNGRRVRRPSASGGSLSDARTSAKWQSVSAVDQSWPIDKSESRMEGTQRTPVSVYLSNLFRESRAVSGRSPTATQGQGRPSTPENDSVHATVHNKTNVPTMCTQAASVPIAESS
eukprot:2264821-Pleurochrysis_carterae.AAC.7